MKCEKGEGEGKGKREGEWGVAGKGEKRVSCLNGSWGCVDVRGSNGEACLMHKESRWKRVFF